MFPPLLWDPGGPCVLQNKHQATSQNEATSLAETKAPDAAPEPSEPSPAPIQRSRLIELAQGQLLIGLHVGPFHLKKPCSDTRRVRHPRLRETRKDTVLETTRFSWRKGPGVAKELM